MVEPNAQFRRGVYAISVAAETVGLGVQTLRLYERHGLLKPARTEGGTRRYSEADLVRLRRIADLLAAGLNLAGVALALDLETQNAQLRAEKEELRWLTTASTRRRTYPRTTSSTSTRRSKPTS